MHTHTHTHILIAVYFIDMGDLLSFPIGCLCVCVWGGWVVVAIMGWVPDLVILHRITWNLYGHEHCQCWGVKHWLTTYLQNIGMGMVVGKLCGKASNWSIFWHFPKCVFVDFVLDELSFWKTIVDGFGWIVSGWGTTNAGANVGHIGGDGGLDWPIAPMFLPTRSTSLVTTCSVLIRVPFIDLKPDTKQLFVMWLCILPARSQLFSSSSHGLRKGLHYVGGKFSR